MRYRNSLDDYESRRHGLSAWSILGVAAVTAIAVVMISSIPDIKRYIRINTM